MSDQPAPPQDQYADAAGDPGEAAGLPVTTGRDPEAGEPDRILEEAP
ncbi:hypothetical protein [Streptomyces sp. NPDC047990]